MYAYLHQMRPNDVLFLFLYFQTAISHIKKWSNKAIVISCTVFEYWKFPFLVCLKRRAPHQTSWLLVSLRSAPGLVCGTSSERTLTSRCFFLSTAESFRFWKPFCLLSTPFDTFGHVATAAAATLQKVSLQILFLSLAEVRCGATFTLCVSVFFCFFTSKGETTPY